MGTVCSLRWSGIYCGLHPTAFVGSRTATRERAGARDEGVLAPSSIVSGYVDAVDRVDSNFN
jgi:hypothetical protein